MLTILVLTLVSLASPGCSSSVRVDAGYDYSWAVNAVNKENIHENLKILAKEPHLAGSDRDEYLAEWIAEQWRGLNLDEVRVEGYNLLLDIPDDDAPNLLKIFDQNNDEVWRSHYKEEGVDDPHFINSFNAYSKAGTVRGDPVYVNFGTIEDFQWLQEKYPDITQEKLCMARYGNIFRGNKAENAASFGCKGLGIFMDPSTVAQEGTDPDNLFPQTFWMPGSAVQRGSLALADGDPETPNWPSLDNVYRLDEEDRAEILPRIPVQPMGYADAYEILSRLEGNDAPAEWQGGLNFTYKIGGKLANNEELQIEVNNKMERRVSSNVIGVIHGDMEPDRMVMFGNHRDAWGFGALDPNSGTAQMMEVVRVLAEKKASGWRPRRTMMFLSWGAEEYSLCGSREFVEQYEMEISDRGVAYLNTDVCLSGPILEPVASPTLMDIFAPATQDIQSPVDEDQSYWEYWKQWSGEADFNPEVSPFVGSGSDHASFIFYAGIPVLDIMFLEDKKLYPDIGGYPAYHTGFETLDLVENLYDANFTIFRACAQLNLRLGLQLAESELLPFKISNYADIMKDGIELMTQTNVIQRLNDLGINTTFFIDAVEEFTLRAAEFDQLTSDKELSESDIRIFNDQMRGFERTFLLYEGLPDRIQYRHVVTAPSLFDAYGGSAFPGIGDLLYKLDQTQENSADNKMVMKQIKKHVSDLMVIIKRAANYLKPIRPSGTRSDATIGSFSVVTFSAIILINYLLSVN